MELHQERQILKPKINYFLLSTEEVWVETNYDTSVGTSKQLDYYKNQGVTTSSYTSAIKAI